MKPKKTIMHWEDTIGVEISENISHNHNFFAAINIAVIKVKCEKQISIRKWSHNSHLIKPPFSALTK